MGVASMFLLLATVTPILFLMMKKPAFAIVHSVLLMGMWVYYFQVLLYTTPTAFSPTWTMFYLALIGTHIGWVMFFIATVKEGPIYKQALQEKIEAPDKI
ncbi:hypothetical protein QRD89_06925 [Halobacillus sp. ACCC02827]|uniref:hypothetical protein n=1 Tax=Bacillaceae TaxID=186817 RepID=UPI0002A4F2A4|nr:MULTISPECIES: hypothetical protein [Bacillaceae]ELK46032.1 hypothetical protein D479_12353 [Halobacillus sp. BAB-2008]QHT46257.1 hypothetical protein M662_07030 [Bacillus sp. SB49]WJE17077.1 hypothetical protein QRD89_06925 [Halobacillus sp. ACCC02827]